MDSNHQSQYTAGQHRSFPVQPPNKKGQTMANILLIDDQPYMEEFLAEELSREGHMLKWIGDSDWLMPAIAETRPDLILLDLYLNGFEGWSLLDRIKRHDPRIPVIILTAYGSFADDPRVSRADGYVVKEFNTGILKEKITLALSSGCARRSGTSES